MKRLAGVFIVLALTACLGGNGSGRLAAPNSTPELGLGLPPDKEYAVEGDQIDLSTPLARPLWLPIAGRQFLVPAGATVVGAIIEGPPADAETGEALGPPPKHPRYTLISRGDSSVKIDDETGEIFEWEVKPEDGDDFEPLRHPE